MAEVDTPAQDWRPVVAALANPDTRKAFAQVVLGAAPESVGEGLSPSKRRHTVAILVKAGLVREVEGRLVEVPEVFGHLLAAAESPRRVGAERFLDGRGQIDRYPISADERRALLVLVAERTLAEGEVVPEAELNERLAVFSPDTAALRRYMVDDEVLERTRSGSEYARVI